MALIKKADPADIPAIARILDEAGLVYPGQPADGFFVAVDNGSIVGIARLEEQARFNFLSSLGVSQANRRRHIASSLVKYLIGINNKPTYLYTIIPDFFSRLGFVPSPGRPDLPPKEIFGCQECEPDRCHCMVKLNRDTPLS